MTGCEKFSVANFEMINSEEINLTKTNLSKEKQYLVNIYREFKTEKCAPDFAVKDPGSFSNSRSLTCANKIIKTIYF